MSEHKRVRPYAERSITGGIYLYLSYNPDFLEWLKATVPSHERTYAPDEKRWYIGSQYAAQVIAKARISFPAFPVDGIGGQREDTPPRQHNHFHGFSFHDMGGQRRQMPPPYRQPPSHYQTLFITSDAPPEVIKAAYKALARLYHPDSVQHASGAADAQRKMQDLNSAYDAIRKERKL